MFGESPSDKLDRFKGKASTSCDCSRCKDNCADCCWECADLCCEILITLIVYILCGLCYLACIAYCECIENGGVFRRILSAE